MVGVSLKKKNLQLFFQAEDGIRDVAVTGVQTCALPIWERASSVCPVRPNVRRANIALSKRRANPDATTTPTVSLSERGSGEPPGPGDRGAEAQIGRASCRERV